MTTITFRPLTPNFGMEIYGVDFSREQTADDIALLRRLWTEASGMLLFRDQHLTPADHVRLTACFGKVQDDIATQAPVLAHYLLEGYPEIYRVSNKKIDGKPLGREDAGTYWHSDGSWMQQAPRGSILYAVELPTVGGDTMFADMAGAYDALSPPVRVMLDGLNAVHSVLNAAISTSYTKEYAGKLDQAASKAAIHPVILKHPVSGRPAIYVNEGFTAKIVELTQLESTAILKMLFDHCTRPDFVYRHRWQLNDVVMWDNFSNMHFAVPNYKAHGWRLLNRTTVLLEA
ncbi:TauD/TfdA dioxygenase family protein [Ottowia thiooxydans]|uniref:Taurine dioxygenase n=1 Tax=Ottowia thiooxydans TaxID=219182 RepID=A0ABV2QEA4_9BURK